MRILFLTPFLPDPDARHGGAVYLGTYLQELAQHADVALASLVSQSEQAAGSVVPDGLARVALVAHTPLRELSGINRWRHKLQMAGAWGPGGMPLLAAKHRSASLASRLTELRSEFAPDVVLVEMAVMAQYLELFEGTPTVLTDHEHGAALPAAIAPLGFGQGRDGRLWQRYVKEHYARASVVQALNSDDAEHLASLLGRQVEVRAPIVPLPGTIVAPARAPARALFLGNYLHAPNSEAAIRLTHEVWPRVRARCAEAELWLAGAHAPSAVCALAKQPGVSVLGAVDDLGELFGQVRLLAAPLYSGGGTRMKALTCLAHGLPVVSNRLGLRGVDAPTPAATLGTSADELADAVIDLFDHPDRAAAAGAAGRRWAEENLSAQRLVSSQLDRLVALTGKA